MNTLRTQMERLQQAINDGSAVAKTTAAKTHFHKHEHVTDVESMNRMLREVPANSAFYPNQNIEFLLEEAMFYKAQDITEWLDTAEPREKKAFQVVFDPDDYDGMIGKGFLKEEFKKDFPEVMREVSYIKHKIRENLPTASDFQNEKTLMTQEVRKQSELVPVTKSREIPDLPYQEPTQESAFEYTK